MSANAKDENVKKLAPLQAIALLGAIVLLLVICAREGVNNAISLGLSWVIIYLFCVICRFDYNKVVNSGYDAIRRCMSSMMIFFGVGMLVGAWIAGGTIPTLISYSLGIISPKIFLPCCLLITSIMSVCTGTSYGSAASAGVAMMGVGLSMNIPAGIVGGAILCGATFGDKISPLSDTTNVCPTLCEGKLFPHIKAQMYTTLPAYLICFIAFTIIGFNYGSDATELTSIQETIAACNANFNISPICLIPLVLVIALLFFKVDVIPALLIGAVSGSILSVTLQGNDFTSTMGYMWSGFSIESGNEIVDKLMNRGGITSMSGTFVMAMFAVGMGAMLEYMGAMQIFVDAIVKRVKSACSLIISTMLVSYCGSCLTMLMTSTHVITSKLMSPLYKQKGLAPEMCSRTMEDTATIGGVLIPWHANSIYYAGVLGVAWSQFAPFCMLSYLVPVFSVICAVTGIGIFYVNKSGERISKEEWKALYPDAK